MADYKKIKAEYIRGGQSIRALSEKYGVSFSTLQKISLREKWTDLRSKTGAKIDQRLTETAASREMRRTDIFESITDEILARIMEQVKNGEVSASRGWKDITGALRDIKELKGIKSELDLQEQMARIEKLHREAQVEEQNKEVRVVIDSSLEEFAK